MAFSLKGSYNSLVFESLKLSNNSAYILYFDPITFPSFMKKPFGIQTFVFKVMYRRAKNPHLLRFNVKKIGIFLLKVKNYTISSVTFPKSRRYFHRRFCHAPRTIRKPKNRRKSRGYTYENQQNNKCRRRKSQEIDSNVILFRKNVCIYFIVFCIFYFSPRSRLPLR